MVFQCAGLANAPACCLIGGEQACRREIADIEHRLRSGHPDIEGFLLAFVDWNAELRIAAAEEAKPLNRKPGMPLIVAAEIPFL